MHSAVQTWLVCVTWPRDQGRIPSAVVSCRDVVPSPSILQAEGSREHQGYPKVGYAVSLGLLCRAQAACALWLLSPRRDRSAAECPLPCRYISASARRWSDAGGFWLRDGGRSWVPRALPCPLPMPGHCGEAARSTAVPAALLPGAGRALQAAPSLGTASL